MKNPLQLLQDHGQSVWLDNLSRSLIARGELKHLIEHDGVRGVTSNPSIFENAIAGTSEYRDMLDAAESQGLDAKALYERIVVRDIQDAADLLQPVYHESKRRDGYVSLEVSPRLAYDTQGTLEEARRLWQTVARENLMIKVPATVEGISAFQELISEGINVNVTLLFAQETYEQVAEAYLRGLEHLAKQGSDLNRVASVASFFISRIDTAVDNWIAGRLEVSSDRSEQALLHSLEGKVAIASAKTTYQKYLHLFHGDRWKALSRHGAQTQRLLWASTGTKNPNYRDVIYIEELIGPDTINTMPPATLDAYRDHGRPHSILKENIAGAQRTMDSIQKAGLQLKELTDKLLEDGVKQFADAFDKLLRATRRGGKEATHDPIGMLELKLMKDLYQGRKLA